MYQVVKSWSFRFSLYSVYNVSCHVFLLWDYTTLTFDLRPWKRGILLSWNPLSQLLDPVTNGSVCILPTIYTCILPRFLPCDNTTLTFELRPWKTRGNLLSSCLSIVSSCLILELTVHSVFCLQSFPTLWQYDLDFWPSTWKSNRYLTLYQTDQMYQVGITWS